LHDSKSDIKVCVPYTSEPFDCIIAYLNNDNLLEHETINIKPDLINLSHDDAQLVTIRTPNAHFVDRLNALPKILIERRSTWFFKLEVNNDVHVTVLRNGANPIYVSFGSSEIPMVESDFIFYVEANTRNFIIPIEVVWQNSAKYPENSRLGLYELVSVDFHKIPNIYYKSPISNSIQLKDFPQANKKYASSSLSPLESA
jgi:hypothetical protein